MLSFIRTSLLIGAVALLGACAIRVAPAPPVFTPPALISFHGVLSASQEVPPTASYGKGLLNAEYDMRTNRLSWTVRYTDLTGPVTAAHFHGPALPGQNADPVVPLTGNLSSVTTGSAVLTLAQRDDLIAGKWYLNLHTARYPDGEIRGQVQRR